MISHWRLRDYKSPKVSKTLLRTQPDLINRDVWKVSTYPQIFKTYSPFTKYLGIALNPPTTFSITATFMVYLFQLSCKVWLLISLLAFFHFVFMICHISASYSYSLSLSLSLLWRGFDLSLGLVVWPRSGDPFVSQNPHFAVGYLF